MPSVSVLISEAQGMCTDRRPHEEINAQLDKVQRALDGGYAKDAQAPGAGSQDRHKGVEIECWECEGTGLTHSGGYTVGGGRLYSDPPCHLCEGSGKAMRFESMDDLISDLEQG